MSHADNKLCWNHPLDAGEQWHAELEAQNNFYFYIKGDGLEINNYLTHDTSKKKVSLIGDKKMWKFFLMEGENDSDLQKILLNDI